MKFTVRNAALGASAAAGWSVAAACAKAVVLIAKANTVAAKPFFIILFSSSVKIMSISFVVMALGQII